MTARGVMNKDHAMEALLLVHGTFPKDKAFLRETKSAEALRTLAPLVSDEVHHGKSPLSPRAWGPFLEFINQSAH
jgi:hypothetical protein